MADKPSRSLILYGHGLAPFISSSQSHLHAAASIACCGFLALHPSSPPPEAENDHLMAELAQLLDASEAICNKREKAPQSEDVKEFPTIGERFMGMKAAIVTSSSDIKCFGQKLGFTGVELDQFVDGQSSDDAALELLKLLGFQSGKTLDTDHFDLVFVHIGANVKENGLHDTENTNKLVGRLLKVAPPGSEIGSRLHLTLVMSFGAAVEGDANLSLASLNDGNRSTFSLLYPRQSYTLRGVNLRDNIRHHCPMLFAQWQDGVTRKDMAQEFSFSEFRKNGANLAIPADRFLYEIAFKLWKAPKYGA